MRVETNKFVIWRDNKRLEDAAVMKTRISQMDKEGLARVSAHQILPSGLATRVIVDFKVPMGRESSNVLLALHSMILQGEIEPL
jgi:DUF1009 family protein